MTQPAKSPVTPRGRFTTATVTRREDFTEDLWRIWLKPEQSFQFKPGQYCTIGVDGIERAYSIVSSPREKEIELFIELVPPPDGELTPLLYDLNVGDTVTLRPRAKGIFVLKPEAKNHLFMATVTGVVPYVSILRYHLETLASKDSASEQQATGDFNFYILEGASYTDEFGYDEELAKLASEHDNIHFVPTVSRPNDERNASWKGETGRVNTLTEKYLDMYGLKPEDTIVYACGHPQMIEDVKDRLTSTDYRVEEERFWKED
jgi:ferredoxin--NADP+ reductase